MFTKLFYSFTGLTLLFLSLAGCSQPENESAENGDSQNRSSAELDTAYSDSTDAIPGVTMRSQFDSYPEGTESIIVLLKNESDEELFYGKAYSLEEETENGWTEVPFEEEMAFIAIAVSLKPDSVNEEMIDLTLFEKDLDRGTYRVVKHIGTQRLTASFSIS